LNITLQESVLKILSQQKLGQAWKSSATGDAPTRAASRTVGGCRLIQI